MPALFFISPWSPVIPGIPWLGGASIQSLPPSAHSLSVSLCVSFPLLTRIPVIGFRVAWQIWPNFNLTNYICIDSISKQSHILKFSVNMNLGEHYSIHSTTKFSQQWAAHVEESTSQWAFCKWHSMVALNSPKLKVWKSAVNSCLYPLKLFFPYKPQKSPGKQTLRFAIRTEIENTFLPSFLTPGMFLAQTISDWRNRFLHWAR